MTFWEQPVGLSKIRAWARAGNSIAKIADKMGIARITLYDWIKQSPKIREAIQHNVDGVKLCLAEDLLKKKMLEGESWAVQMYLKSKLGAVYGSERLDGVEPPDDLGAETLQEIQKVIRGEL